MKLSINVSLPALIHEVLRGVKEHDEQVGMSQAQPLSEFDAGRLEEAAKIIRDRLTTLDEPCCDRLSTAAERIDETLADMDDGRPSAETMRLEFRASMSAVRAEAERLEGR